jgi:hypothetical protein
MTLLGTAVLFASEHSNAQQSVSVAIARALAPRILR